MFIFITYYFINCPWLVMLQFDGILPKGPYPPCLRMADRALLAGYPRIMVNRTIREICMSHTCYTMHEILNPFPIYRYHNDKIDDFLLVYKIMYGLTSSLEPRPVANDFPKSCSYRILLTSPDQIRPRFCQFHWTAVQYHHFSIYRYIFTNTNTLESCIATYSSFQS